MSLLQEVIEQYGDFENAETPTDKTAKTPNKPKALTDKTAKTSSVSFGSEWSEGLKTKKDPSSEPAKRIDWGKSPLVQSVDKLSKELQQSPDEIREAAEDDWGEVSNDPAQLLAFADSLAIVQIRESGGVPDAYVSVTTCQNCGEVPIWPGCPPRVKQCPWCMNGTKAPPFPEAKE